MIGISSLHKVCKKTINGNYVNYCLRSFMVNDPKAGYITYYRKVLLYLLDNIDTNINENHQLLRC